MWSKAVEWVRVQWARALKHWPWLLVILALAAGHHHSARDRRAARLARGNSREVISMWSKVVGWAKNKAWPWIRAHWMWIAGAVVLVVVGIRWGWKLAAILGGGGVLVDSTRALSNRAVEQARQTVADTLENKKRRQAEAERIRKEMDR